MTRLRRPAAILLLALLTVLLFGSPAGAHAQLVSTDPANSAVLPEPPRSLLLTFNEPVEISLGAVRLYDSTGERLSTSTATHAGGDRRTVQVEARSIGVGSYVASWRVVSSDGHPLRGAFAFQVGAGSGVDTTALSQQILQSNSGSVVVGSFFTADRLIELASLVVLAGGLVFLLWLWPAGRRFRRARALLWGAWAVALAGTVAGMGLQGAYAGGLTLGEAFRPSVYDAVLDTRFGQAAVARLAVLAAIAALLVILGRRPGVPGLPWKVAGSLLAVAVLVPSSVAGHAGTIDPALAGIVPDVIHMAAVATWLGGLVMLVAVALLRGDDEEVETLVPRFSTVAFVSVIVIAVTGSVRGWQEVGSLYALTNSAYGELLITKLAIFAVLIVVAALSRRWVRRRTGGDGATVLALRKRVAWEVVLAAAVLTVTAFLVNVDPAKNTSREEIEVFATYLQSPEALVQMTVDPPAVGTATVHFYIYEATGARYLEVPEMSARMSLPDKDVVGLQIPVVRAGEGHFVASAVQMPLKGRWDFEVNLRLSDIDSVRLTTVVPIQ